MLDIKNFENTVDRTDNHSYAIYRDFTKVGNPICVSRYDEMTEESVNIFITPRDLAAMVNFIIKERVGK